MKTLASHIASEIDRELEAGAWPHCAVYEKDVARLWPLEQIDREKRIAEFAKEYGFTLRFYSKGLCAIFTKDSWPLAQTANEVPHLTASAF